MSWGELEAEVERRREAGRAMQFWWRDDDATGATTALEQLLSLSRAHKIPLALAVIPQDADAALFRMLHPYVSVIQHGTDHRNRAAAGEKKTEYPAAEPLDAALHRVSKGMQRLRDVPGFIPVLAPPWNRLRKELLGKLPAIGIRGVSMYGPGGGSAPAPGLRQVNTHVDIVAWRRGRRFIGEAEAIRLALKQLANDEPLGWLTHHAVHDAAAWDFLARLFTLPGVRWLSVAEAFSYTARADG